MASQDDKYMHTALKLARRGIGSVEPNPAVGCIIIKGNQIAGRGWHKRFGGPHAEINAIDDCKNLGINPKDSTMFVTLEPCCHHGKTGPCTEAIIAAQPARVVVATVDSSAKVNGKGIEQLRNAGIEVTVGVCETEAKLLNAPFLKFTRTGKPWVILKWAQTIDGKLAWADTEKQQRWISNELSRRDAHKLRRRAQAILVGINTVLADDPLLTPRPARRDQQLVRIILDSYLRIPLDSQLVRTAKKTPLLILTSQKTAETNPQAVEQITETGAELLIFPDTPGMSNLHFLIDQLSSRGIEQLLVEGGPTVIASFLREGLADEIYVYISPRILGANGTACITEPLVRLSTCVDLLYTHTECFDGDIRLSGFSKRALNEISIGEI